MAEFHRTKKKKNTHKKVRDFPTSLFKLALDGFIQPFIDLERDVIPRQRVGYPNN